MFKKLLSPLIISAGLLIGMGCASTEPAFVQDGLVAYFPFNGNSKDESGNNLHGKPQGASLTTDRHESPDRAYQFNGVTSYISVEDSHIWKVTPATISVWALATADGLNNPRIICSGNPGSDNLREFFICRGSKDYSPFSQFHYGFGKGFNNSGWRQHNANWPLNSWQHLVITYDMRVLKLYLNGKLADQKNIRRIN